jgi:hypothetical protein
VAAVGPALGPSFRCYLLIISFLITLGDPNPT